MITVIDKEKFYHGIWENYKRYDEYEKYSKRRKHEDNKEKCEKEVCNSFVYKYFEEKKEKDANDLWNKKTDIKLDPNSRADHYVNLTYAYKCYENGKISEKEIVAYIEGLKGKKRAKESRAITVAWRELEELDRDDCHKKELLDRIKDELKYIFLCQTIIEFFRNIGYSKRNPANYYGDSEKDKRDDTLLDMYLQYVLQENNEGTDDSQSVFVENVSDLDATTIKDECEKLVEWANNQGNEIAIPIAFEKQTGAGLFILNNFILYELEGLGNYCIIRFDSIELSDDEQSIDFVDEKEASLIEFTQHCELLRRFENLEKAIKFFQSSKEYFDGYRAFNGKYPIDIEIKRENSRYARFFLAPGEEKKDKKETRVAEKELLKFRIKQEQLLEEKKNNRYY